MVRPLTKRQEGAALAIAEDMLPDTEIARTFGVTVWALDKWKQREDFRARVHVHRLRWQQEIELQGIANVQNRIDAYNRDWRDLERIKEARSAHYADEVPGGETGLIVGRPVLVRVTDGDDDDPRYREVMEYRLDTGFLEARLKTAKQAAQELGQWIEKSESRNETAVLGVIGVSAEDL